VSEYGGTIEMPGPGLPAQGAAPMMRFENYAILQKEDGAAWELGRGAMGITYKAQDTGSPRAGRIEGDQSHHARQH
jgi:hypothetical protein